MAWVVLEEDEAEEALASAEGTQGTRAIPPCWLLSSLEEVGVSCQGGESRGRILGAGMALTNLEFLLTECPQSRAVRPQGWRRRRIPWQLPKVWQVGTQGRHLQRRPGQAQVLDPRHRMCVQEWLMLKICL